MKCSRVIALLAVLISPSVFAQEGGLVCEECRNLDDFPVDAGFFGLNQFYGPDAWLNAEQANLFNVADTFGNIVSVDLNFSYQGNWWPVVWFGRWIPFIGVLIPPLSPEATLQVIVRDANAMLVFKDSFPIPATEFPLPVGGDGTEPPSDGSGNVGGEDEDEDWLDDEDSDGDFEWEDDDDDGPVGTVVIEDPDEDGNFTDPGEWCEEC